MPWPERLAGLQPHLDVITDALAEYTASAEHAEDCPVFNAERQTEMTCDCVPHGALYDADTEQEIILAYLRWLAVDTIRAAAATGGRRKRRLLAGYPGRKPDLALAV